MLSVLRDVVDLRGVVVSCCRLETSSLWEGGMEFSKDFVTRWMDSEGCEASLDERLVEGAAILSS